MKLKLCKRQYNNVSYSFKGFGQSFNSFKQLKIIEVDPICLTTLIIEFLLVYRL